MKYAKMLGLLAVAAAALMAFAGTASADVATAPTGTVYTSTITAEAEGAAGVTLHGSFTSVNCKKSHVEGKIEKHGAGIPVSGKISTLSFSECNFPVTVLAPGELIAHATSGGNATLTSSGAQVTIQTSIASCLFTTSGTDLGTLTGAPTSTGHATLDISAQIPRTGHSVFCGSSGTWTGSYTVTVPKGLLIDKT